MEALLDSSPSAAGAGDHDWLRFLLRAGQILTDAHLITQTLAMTLIMTQTLAMTLIITLPCAVTVTLTLVVSITLNVAVAKP